MLDSGHLLSWITFSPLIGILLLLAVPAAQSRLIQLVAVVSTLVPLVLSLRLYAAFKPGGAGLQFKEEMTWLTIPLNHEAGALRELKSFFLQFKYIMAVDGLSVSLVVLTTIVATMAALASVYIKKRFKTYYILFLLLEVGMLGVFMARDLFQFFVFFELTIIPMFFLIGIWGYVERERAANKFLIYNGIGSAIMLIAFLILISTAGFTQDSTEAGTSIFYSGDLNIITAHLFGGEAFYVNVPPDQLPGNPFYLSAGMKWGLAILMLVAFGIKLPIFPFHTWMLKVHTEAPPSIVMIHSGILLKMGAYGLIRFGLMLFPEQAAKGATFLAVLGVINILYGAVLAFVQKEFKLVLAYSSISHMGIVLLGLAALNATGIEGAMFQLISHGLISALMFLLVGALYERTGTTSLDELGGLAKSLPFLSAMFLTAAMANLGLPGMSGFVSEFLAFTGLFASMKVITAVGTLGVILTAVYMLRGVLGITYGPQKLTLPDDQSLALKPLEVVPMVVLVSLIILIGVFPSVLSTSMNASVTSLDQFIHSIVKIGG